MIAASAMLGVTLWSEEPLRYPGAFDLNLLVGYLIVVPVLLVMLVLVIQDLRSRIEHGRAFDDGVGHFIDAITDTEAVAAIKLTLISSLIVVAINAVMGTLIAWVLVRDDFRGKRLVNSVIDLPFALPTIVAGLTLIALYGPNSPIGFKFSTWSQMDFTTIMIGRPRITPHPPQSQPQNKRPANTMKLFMLLARPESQGVSQ